MSVLVATDLDRTLIYSRGALAADPVDVPLTCVEVYDGSRASFMTDRAAALLRELVSVADVVPVTTRVRRQYRRVNLPAPASRFAIVANGGQILVDGRPDPDWDATVAERLAGCEPVSAVEGHLAAVCRPEWTNSVRTADGLFCYAVVHPRRIPAGFVDDLTGWAASRGWRTSLQGRKVYCVPAPLTKAAALAEVRERLGARTVLAAGDSLLDIDLLLAADRGMHPAHGELFGSGWSAPHVRTSSAAGVLAGEQIVEWFLTAARTP